MAVSRRAKWTAAGSLFGVARDNGRPLFTVTVAICLHALAAAFFADKPLSERHQRRIRLQTKIGKFLGRHRCAVAALQTVYGNTRRRWWPTLRSLNGSARISVPLIASKRIDASRGTNGTP